MKLSGEKRLVTSVKLLSLNIKLINPIKNIHTLLNHMLVL